MGIPYSKQINQAFDQVTPLVASGYELLETTKNIALFITAIEIGIIFLLFLNLLALLGLLFTLNPDLEKERKEIVTPVMKWIAAWKYSISGVLVGCVVLTGFGYLFYVRWMRQQADEMADDFVREDEGVEDDSKSGAEEGDEGEKDGESK